MVVQAKTESDFWTLPLMIFFFKILFYQKSCKEVMNIGVGQSRGGFFLLFVVKKCPFLYLLVGVQTLTPINLVPGQNCKILNLFQSVKSISKPPDI